jgi:hypothetical protein
MKSNNNIILKTHGQEAATRDIDTVSATEVLDGGTNGSFELNDLGTIIHRLIVDDNIEFETVLLLHDTLDSGEGNVDRVGVEVLELADRLEVFNVLLGHLGNFEQADSAIIVNNGTTLYVCLGLVRELHEELGLRVDEVAENLEIHIGTKIVNVRDKDVLLAGFDQLFQETRVGEGVEDVTVAGRVPLRLIRGGTTGDGEERVLVDTGVSGLVEGEDLDVVVGILLDDALGVLVGVERVHENERHVDLVFLIEVLKECETSSPKTIECIPQSDGQRDPRMSCRHELPRQTWEDRPYP